MITNNDNFASVKKEKKTHYQLNSVTYDLMLFVITKLE